MRRLKALLGSALLLIAVFAFCSCGGEEQVEVKKYPTKTLNVYNWGEYISNEDDEEYGLFDVNAAFEEYFNENLADKYGFYVKVNYSTYANNEDMYAKLTNSAVAYDVVVPSDYMIEKMIEDKMLLPLDYSLLTNYGNISDDFKNLYYDPKNAYSVPYTYGMVGIIYNSEFVDEALVKSEESWSLLWNQSKSGASLGYEGKILQFNNPRDAFASAMYLNGLNVNSHDPADWNKALEALKAQKPILQGYVNDEIFNKMKSASAWISAYYAGDYLTMAADNDDLRFYYPSEGTNYFVDAMCVPKTSRNPEIATEYINYMIGLDAATANALYIGYASPNRAVIESEYYAEMLDYNYSIYDDEDNLLVDAWEVLYGKTKDEANANYPFNPAYEKYYKDDKVDIQVHVNSLWESLKTENSTELWVHITSIIIVVGVVSYASYDLYVKKKRSKDYRARDKQARLAKGNK